MYSGKLVFAQLMDHLPMHTFRRCVDRFERLKLDASLSEILQKLSVTLFEKMLLDQLLMNLQVTDERCADAKQLKLQVD